MDKAQMTAAVRMMITMIDVVIGQEITDEKVQLVKDLVTAGAATIDHERIAEIILLEADCSLPFMIDNGFGIFERNYYAREWLQSVIDAVA